VNLCKNANDISQYVLVIETLGSMIRAKQGYNVRGLLYTIQFFASLARRSNLPIQPLLDALRLEYAHLRREDDPDRQIGMMVCLVEIIKICHSTNPNLIESLLASAEGILVNDDNLPQSVSITFHYFVAKHCLFMDRFDEARTELDKAYDKVLSSGNVNNTVAILRQLIPLRMIVGIFPSKKLFEKFPSLWPTFKPILKAVARRDLCALRAQRSLALFGLVPRIELLIHRLIVRDIHRISGSRKVSLFVLAQVLQCSAGIAGEVAANLILEQRITGYISYEEGVLVLTGTEPFPKCF